MHALLRDLRLVQIALAHYVAVATVTPTRMQRTEADAVAPIRTWCRRSGRALVHLLQRLSLSTPNGVSWRVVRCPAQAAESPA